MIICLKALSTFYDFVVPPEFSIFSSPWQISDHYQERYEDKSTNLCISFVGFLFCFFFLGDLYLDHLAYMLHIESSHERLKFPVRDRSF